MEVLAAGSSIAGLLSLAGQCVAGAQALRDLYKDMTTASKTIETFVKDVDAMIGTLFDVEALLNKLKEQSSIEVDRHHFINLSRFLDDDKRAIQTWLATARSFPVARGKGARAWFRKFWATVNQNSVKNIRADIESRRLNLTVALSTLGRYAIALYLPCPSS